VRRVENDAHEDTGDGTGNRDGGDPRDHEEADTLEVDGLEGAVAEADADGGARDAHRRGDGEGELGEDEDGDGRAHLHGRAARGGVVGDLVAHD
jgi:hypothetical protein